MKEFFQLMRRFVSPYKKYLGWSIVLNVLSAVFNIFSFSLLIPILNILFKTGSNDKVYHFMEWGSASLKDVATNNFYYYTTRLIDTFGPATTLLFLGLFLGFMTLLKTACYFGSSAIMIPLRTGVVRDIRLLVYRKVVELPLGFFSEERKGDIIARMSGDVNEVETSVTSSLDMLLKNPILIISYFTTLIVTSWQLTLFTILVLPTMGWVMGKVGRALKRQSLDAQNRWSDTMSQLEETLGGLRIIKAFIAEKKMTDRFQKCCNDYRDAVNKVAIRQSSAHPMSEFLGTLLIVAVLWFGGSLILSNNAPIDASTFIFYMVILYSIINPLKEFSKASYNIPRGLASMERIDKILKAENPIKETTHPETLNDLQDRIEFKNISFSYDGKKDVLKDINLTIPKGKTIALVGQSGSGKSTLTRIMFGLEQPDSGDVLFNGVSILGASGRAQLRSLRAASGIVYQNPFASLDPRWTAGRSIAEPLRLAGERDERGIGGQVSRAMELVGLEPSEFMGRYPMDMSGGQAQRVAIARAVVKDPQVMLADEAMSAIDVAARMQILDAFAAIRERDPNMAMVLVSHDLGVVQNIADRIVVMHEGRVVESGPSAQILEQPQQEYTRLLIAAASL